MAQNFFPLGRRRLAILVTKLIRQVPYILKGEKQFVQLKLGATLKITFHCPGKMLIIGFLTCPGRVFFRL